MRRVRFTVFLVLVSVFFVTSSVFAGGPITVNTSGVAASWASGAIALHPETGTCGTFTNAQMLTKLAENVALWEVISGITLDYTITSGTISKDVTASNYTQYFVDSSDDAGVTDSINPVVFDDDGAIVDAIFGTGSSRSTLGFAGPDTFNSTATTILGGEAFFNCRCLAGNPSGACGSGSSLVTFTEDDLDFTMTHEIGHMTGLDHTQVNQALEDDCNIASAGDCDDLPAMYPVSVDPADQITPTRDDEVAMLTLYGLSSLTSAGCTVTGTLLDADGDELRCADVQAQTTDTGDTIAQVSGVYATYSDTDGNNSSEDAGDCISGCGGFTLRGLTPNVSYTIKVLPVDPDWTGGSSLSPCVNDPPTGVAAETIASVTAASCTAGSTVALGQVTTTSTGGTSATTSSSSSSSGGSSSGGGSSSAGCSVAPGDTEGSVVVLFLFAAGLTGFWIRRFASRTSRWRGGLQ